MLKSRINTINIVAFIFVLFLFSCSENPEEETANPPGELPEEQFYANLALPVTVKKSTVWPGNKEIRASAEVREMQVVFYLNMNKFAKSIIPVSPNKKDTFLNVFYNFSFTCNNQALKVVLNPEKHRWFYRNGFGTENDSLLDHTTSIKKLNTDTYLEVKFPLFALSAFPANKPITVDVHVWQDCFLSDEKKKKELTEFESKHTFSAYYRDTLKSKLIDNVYSFTVTVPAIYRTDIICDSIVLQNDKEWNPYGSDNTLWKSTLPDIYFSINDLYNTTQGSSTVEKSTDKFTIGDTVPYYHYKEKETFYVEVYDFDMLSKNDMLGWYKTNLSMFSEAKNYCLKFGHINKFCFRRKSYGKIN